MAQKWHKNVLHKNHQTSFKHFGSLSFCHLCVMIPETVFFKHSRVQWEHQKQPYRPCSNLNTFFITITLRKLLNLPELQCLHLQYETNNTYFAQDLRSNKHKQSVQQLQLLSKQLLMLLLVSAMGKLLHNKKDP